MKPLLLCLIGPTAVGKTDLAIRLAKDLKTEIISCDSRQMYQEMKIGTAVPSKEQLGEVPHHFIQHLSIHDYYSVFAYETAALVTLDRLFKQTPIVVLTGGSGLYLNALLWGMDDIPDPDPDIRQRLEERLQQEGLDSLRLELKRLDPDYYQEVDIKNPNRILRGLEVCLTTGKPFSTYRLRSKRSRRFDHQIICLNRDRAELFERINQRVDQMVETGLLEEASRLYPYKSLNALKTVGYREIFEWMDGKTDKITAIEWIKRNTRRYARRQITWNKKYEEALWLDAASDNLLEEIKNNLLW